MNWFKNKRILVPFDFSDACVQAVEVALTLAESKDDLHVLHVLADLPAAHPYAIWDEQDEQRRKEAARSSMEKTLAELDVANTHLDVAIGNAGNRVAELAEELNAGLIVIPSHGRTGVKRLLLGSVAERVVRLAPCPVLVLKDGTKPG